jgi:hypothetical protein
MNPDTVAIGPLLALPDRHVALDAFHQPFRRGKGLATVRCARGDGHARLADRDLPEPVSDDARGQSICRHRFVTQLGEDRDGERFVGLVGEPPCLHTGGHTPRRAGEQHVCPGGIVSHGRQQTGCVDRLPHQ